MTPRRPRRWVRRALAVAVSAAAGLSGVQCLSDLIVAPSVPDYHFDPLSPASYTVNIGDTTAIPRAQLTVGGEIVEVGLGASVVSGATVLKVDSLGRLIVLGPGDGVLRVFPINAALATDTPLHTEFTLHAAVPVLAVSGPDTVYAFKDTVTLTAQPRSLKGVAIAGAPVTWALVSGGAFVTLIDAANGRFRGDANGDAVVKATSDSATFQRTLRVRQKAITVVPGSAVTLRWIGQTQQLNPVAQDQRSNAIAGATLTYTSLNTAVATVTTTGLVTAVAAGSATIRVVASGPGGGSVTDNSNVVSVALGHLAAVSGDNQSASLGQPLAQPQVVQLQDAANANVTQAGVPVLFHRTGLGNGFWSNSHDTMTVLTTSQGRASASFVQGALLATDTLRATGTGLTGTPVVFFTHAAPPARLVITTEPGNVQQGGSPQIVVAVRDSFGATVNVFTAPVTAAFLPGTFGGAHLLGTTTVNAALGVATFGNLTPDSVRNGYRIVMTSAGLVSDTSVAFNVTTGPVDHLAFRVQPSNAAPGAAIAPAIQVEAQDAGNNTVTIDNGRDITLSMFTIPAGGSISLNGTPIATTVNGVATFSDVRIANAASGYRLRATTAGLAGGATSAFFNILGGASNLAIVSGNNQNDLVNAVLSPFVVRVTDAGGTPVAGDSVIFKVTAGGGKFSGIDSAIVLTDASGLASASLTMGAATGTNTATARSKAIGAGSTVTFNASATAANLHLVFLAFAPSNVQGGAAIAPAIQVAVQDASNNSVTSATTIVTLAIASGTGTSGAAIGGTVSVAAINGIATFNNVTIDRVGTGYQLAASANAVTGATSTAFDVTVGAAAKVGFVQQPASGVAGAPLASFSAAIQDAGGNTVTSYVGSVVVSIKAGSGVTGAHLRGTAQVSLVNGVATFTTVSIDSAGAASYQLTAVEGGNPALTAANSTTFSITPAPAVRLAFQVSPAGAIAGTAITPAAVVLIQDSLGNTVTSAGNAITLAIASGPAATLLGTTTVGASSGAASFPGLRIRVAGSYTLSASATGLTGTTSTALVVSSAPASRLVFGQQPTDVVVNTSISPAVQVVIQDSVGNTIVSGANITLAVTGGSPALQGTTTVGASGGIATFSAIKVPSAANNLTLTATSSGLTSAVSGSFNVSATATDRLRWVVVPGPTETAGTKITSFPQVDIETSGGASTTRTDAVTVSITSGTGTAGAHVIFTATVNAVSGTATFTNVSVDSAGTGYTMTATAAGITSAVSSPSFTVVPGVPKTLAYLSGPSSRTAGNVFSPAIQVAVLDSLGNRTTNTSSSVTLSVAGATLSGTTTQSTGATGVATFADVFMTQVGVGYAMTAAVSGVPSIQSSTFSITAGPLAGISTVQGFGLTAGTSFSPGATPHDAFGNTLSTTITWASLNPTVATVNASTGLVTAVAGGQTAVTASGGGITAAMVVTVAASSATTVNLWAPVASGVGDAITGFWAASPTSVYAATDGGRTLHWNGAGWSIVHSAIGGANLFGIWGVADSGQVLAGTQLYQLTGSTPTLMANDPVAPAFNGVWGVTRSDFHAVSQEGSIASWDGSAFILSRPASGVALRALYGFAHGTVFAVGDGGTVLQFNGGTWNAVSGTGASGLLFGVWGTGVGDVFVVGQGGQVLHQGNTLAWSNTTTAGGFNLRGVWGSSGSDVYVVGDNGAMASYNGTAWATVTSGVASQLYAVGGTQTGDVFAGGSGGLILRGVRGALLSLTRGNLTLTSLGDTVTNTVVAADEFSAVITGLSNGSYAWTSSTPATATVSSTGLVTAVANGTTNICASAPGGAQGCYQVTVAQAVASITVTPAGASATAGSGNTTLSANMKDARGNTIPGAAAVFASLNSGIATVGSSSGVVTPVAAGQVVISATAGTVTGYALMTVNGNAAPVNLWVQMISGTNAYQHSVWGVSSSEVFAVGSFDQNTTVMRYNGSSWTGIAGVPGTTSFLYSVWGTSVSDVFAVGLGGTVVRYNGSGWSTLASGTTQNLFSTWGSSPIDVYAGGFGGTLLHYGGASWSPVTSGTTQGIDAIWGTSSANVYAAGENGIILRFDGLSWAPMTSGTSQQLLSLWGTSASEVFAVGEAGSIVRYNGTGWSGMTSGTSQGLLGVWGSSGSDIYAVGRLGTILRYNGSAWNPMTSGTTVNLTAAWGAPTGDVFVLTDGQCGCAGGALLRGVRGATVTLTPASPTLTALGATQQMTPTARDAVNSVISGLTNSSYTWTSRTPSVATVSASGLVTAVANGTARIVAIAPGGAGDSTTVRVAVPTSIQVSPAGVSLSSAGATTTLSATVLDGLGQPITGQTVSWLSLNTSLATVNSGTGVVTAASSGQVTIMATSGSVTGAAVITVAIPGAAAVNLWTPMVSGTGQALRSAWGSSGSDIFASGVSGGIMHYDGASWSTMTSGTTENLFTPWGISGSDVYTGGDNGTILRYNGTSWSGMTSGTTNQVRGIWGSSGSDIFASGIIGTMLRYNGTAWNAQGSGTFQPLTSVWGTSSSNVFAVGGSGTILRYNGTSWNPMTSGTSESLTRVWGTSNSDIFATGLNGVILHYDGTNWSPMTSGTSQFLFTVWGSSGSDVYAVGDLGTILRYNGTSWSTMTTGSSAALQGVWGTRAGDVYAVGGAVAGGAEILRGVRGATVTLAPVSPTLTAFGATQQMTPTARDAANAVISGLTNSSYTWTSRTPSVATVNATGLVTAVANGTARIVALAPGGAGDSTTVTVNQVVATVSFATAGTTFINNGVPVDLTPSVKDATGNAVTRSYTTSCTTSNSGIISVSLVGSACRMTSVQNGQASMAATVEGVSGYHTATVVFGASPAVNLWAPVTSPTGANLVSVWGTSASNVFAVADNGRIIRYNGSAWSISFSSTEGLQGVWCAADTAVYAVGNNGMILKFDGTNWTQMTSNSSSHFQAVWGTARNDIYAVNTSGAVQRYNGSSWSEFLAPGSNPVWRGIWGTSRSDIFVVGGTGSGTTNHYDGSSWSTVASSRVLYGGWSASSTDGYAAGAFATLRRWNGASWSAMIAESLNADAHALWGSSASDIYAVGYPGYIKRWNGGSWSQLLASGTTQTLNSVWGFGSTVFVVGNVGTILQGYRGATVTLTPASPTLTAISATLQMTATARDASAATITALSNSSYTWVSRTPAVATVSASGLVTAVANGTARIVALAPGGAGDSTTVTVSVAAALTRFTSGYAHTCALNAAGQAYCWGWNGNGQLGDGTGTDRGAPTAVIGGLTFQTLSAGDYHTCGLTVDGQAYCWGSSQDGRLGGSSLSPVTPVSGGLSFRSLAAGGSQTCGVTTSGAAYCWGRGTDGQLGNGGTASSSVPLAVGGGQTFQSIVSGLDHVCGLTTGGSAYCWGRGGNGQVGNGSFNFSNLNPVQVTGGQVFQSLAAGDDHTCGLTAAGSAYCWGYDFFGQLGNAANSSLAAPVAVSGGLTFQSLGAGDYTTCGITTGGSARCWGMNNNGQIGDGTTTDRSVPTAVLGGLTFSAIAGGRNNTCARTTGGAAYCWGDMEYQALGNGTSPFSTAPPATPISGLTAQAVAAGATHTCALNAAGAALCWGSNQDGQNGAGTTSFGNASPVSVIGGHTFQAVVSGAYHSCGLVSGGQVWCWGGNFYGELGNNSTTSSSTPVQVQGGQVFQAIGAGNFHTCGLTTVGQVYCWGFNSGGELGNNSTANSSTPVAVSGGLTFLSLAVGGYQACGLISGGSVRCWGENTWGQLGNASTTNSAVPVTVTGGSVFQSLFAGNQTMCGLLSGGVPRCWGANYVGQLGDGTTSTRTAPTALSTAQTFQSIAGGDQHTCGLTTGGSLHCWGANFLGQVGDGTTTGRLVPTAVSGGLTIASLTAGTGGEHSCGRTSAGAVYCWGYYLNGQLGDGRFGYTSAPTTAVSGGVVFLAPPNPVASAGQAPGVLGQRE